LISYVYATIPNFLSIISFRLQKTNLKLSNKLEVISKRYGLSSYMLSIFLIVLLNANLNPENSSSLISWMAGR
jgi:Ca2+/Na+ antiporter